MDEPDGTKVPFTLVQYTPGALPNSVAHSPNRDVSLLHQIPNSILQKNLAVLRGDGGESR